MTFAGVQGGAGVSTVTLLACGAVTRASEHPAVAIDLAAGTRGGLGGLAGAWSQTSAETTAELVIAGGRLARPYTQTQDGVHIISAEPQAVVAIDQTARKLLAATAEAVERHAADSELAALARAWCERRGDRGVCWRQPGDSTGGAAQAGPRGARPPQPRRHRPRSRRRRAARSSRGRQRSACVGRRGAPRRSRGRATTAAQPRGRRRSRTRARVAARWRTCRRARSAKPRRSARLPGRSSRTL